MSRLWKIPGNFNDIKVEAILSADTPFFKSTKCLEADVVFLCSKYNNYGRFCMASD